MFVFIVGSCRGIITGITLFIVRQVGGLREFRLLGFYDAFRSLRERFGSRRLFRLIVCEVNLSRDVGVCFCSFCNGQLFGRKCIHIRRHTVLTEGHTEEGHFTRSEPRPVRRHPLRAVLGIERRNTLGRAWLLKECLFPLVHIVRISVGGFAVEFDSVFLRDVDHLWPTLFLAVLRTFHRLVGNLEPECGSMPLPFRRDTDDTAEEFYDCLADRQSESGALYEAVELYEAFEYLPLVFNGDSGACVLTAEI